MADLTTTPNETKDETIEPPSSSNSGGRRTKLGRRARKRRRKYLQIKAAANAAALGEAENSNPQTRELAANSNGHDRTDQTTSPISDLLPTTSKNNPATSRTNSNDPSAIPTDRSYEQARVREISKLTDTDRQMLARQLGYLPGNALEVVARMKDAFGGDGEDGKEEKISSKLDGSVMDEPLVVKLYPLVLRDETDGTKSKRRRRRQDENANEPLLEPFPTIYWVTHPRIKALVSKLELDRMGTECENILKKDLDEEGTSGNGDASSKQQNDSASSSDASPASPTEPDSALASMKKAHLAYGKERKTLILSQDWDYIQQRKWERAFDASTRGVAGIRNPASVKCLHAHVAHFWSGCRDNVVGKWVAERVAQALGAGASS